MRALLLIARRARPTPRLDVELHPQSVPRDDRPIGAGLAGFLVGVLLGHREGNRTSDVLARLHG